MYKGMKTEKSEKMYKEAKIVTPVGVYSGARAYKPYPLFIKSGKGSKIYDVDGNEYVDYLLAYGPLIHGHAHPRIIEAVKEQLEKGTMYGAPHELEIEVSKKIIKHVPCAKMVRFANSGSEAVSYAVRMARAYTGRKKIIKFEGNLHMFLDTLLVSVQPPLDKAGPEKAPYVVPASLGIPEGVTKDVIVLPWNDAEVVEKAVKEHRDQVAAVITEPYMANTVSIPPEEGYLQSLREITEENDIPLIFDEVITGYRLSLGGAQKLYGVTPDICTLAKALGAGFPISAFCGRREIMETIGPGKMMQSGTYSSNPLVMAAARASLELLEAENGHIYREIHARGRRMIDGIENALQRFKMKAHVQGPGPFFQICFTPLEKIRNYREACNLEEDPYLKLWWELLKRGIYYAQSHVENWFISSVHTNEDVEKTIVAVEESLRAIAS